MNQSKILKEFASLSDDNNKAYKKLKRLNPFQYEKEFGKPLIEWNDEDLMNMFVDKERCYKIVALWAEMKCYRLFFQFCKDKGYRKDNPFENTICLSAPYLMEKMIEAGNVMYYTEDYLKEECAKQSDNYAYFYSIIFSIYEGIKNYKELSMLKFSDVDILNGEIKGLKGVVVSDDLRYQYVKLQSTKEFYTPFGTLQMDDEGWLIKRLIKKGQTKATGKTPYINLSSNIKSNTDIDCGILYDSGVVKRLCNYIGVEKFIEYLVDDEKIDRVIKVENNKRLQYALEDLGIKKEIANFTYDYRIFALAIKYGAIEV